MSILFSCDGCGKTGDGFTPLGVVIVVHYCSDCKEKAESFLRERNAIRAKLVNEFSAAKAVLVARFSANNFKLPDEPAV